MKRFKGYLITITAAVGFGIQPLLASFAFEYGVGSLLLALARVALMVPVFAVIVLLRGERFLLSARDAACIAFLALTGAALTTGLLFTSYSMIDTGTATTLNFSYPVFVLALGAIFYREKIGKTTWVSFALCIAGVLLFCNPSGAFSWKGFWLALGSGLTYGIYVLLLDKSRILDRVGFYPFTFYFFLFSFLMLLPFVWIKGELQLTLPGTAWLLLVLFALDGGIIATVLLQVGIREIGSGRAAIIGALEPVTSVILGAIFLRETIRLSGIIAMLLIISSTVLLIAADKEKSPAGLPEKQKESAI